MVSTGTTRSATPIGRNDTITLVATATMLAILAAATIAYFDYAAASIVFPGTQDYGEGPLLYQLEWLQTHGTIYYTISEPPYAVSNYPPVFHYTTWLMTDLVPDPLTAGRLVSFIAGLVSAVLIFTLVFRLTGDSHTRVSRLFGGSLAALFFLSHFSVTLWSVMARVDMLALSLGLLGMLIFELAHGRKSQLLACVSGLIFVLAAYTKQNMIAAPAATLLAAFLFDRRLLTAALAASLPTGLIVMAFLHAGSGGEFLLHTFYYNLNEFNWGQLDYVSQAFVWSNGVEILILVFGLAYLSIRRRQKAVRRTTAATAPDLALTLFSSFMAFGLLSSLATLKKGAAANYYLEFEAAGSLLLGLIAVRVVKFMGERRGDALYGKYQTAVILGLAMLTWNTIHGWESKYRHPREFFVPDMERLAKVAESFDGPVISEDMVLLYRMGKPLYYQPFIMTQLARAGTWDPGQLLEKMRSGEIAMIVLTHQNGPAHCCNRFFPEFREVLERHYRQFDRLGQYSVYVPSKFDAPHELRRRNSAGGKLTRG